MLKEQLNQLLGGIDSKASLPMRNLWLYRCLRWLRNNSNHPDPDDVIMRLKLLVREIENNPSTQERAAEWWQTFLQSIELTSLLADFGFAPRQAFMSEFFNLLTDKFIPTTLDTNSSLKLFKFFKLGNNDRAWLEKIDQKLLAQLIYLLQPRSNNNSVVSADVEANNSSPTSAMSSSSARALQANARNSTTSISYWQQNLLTAIIYCCHQISATGFDAEVRDLMHLPNTDAHPFWQLTDLAKRFAQLQYLHQFSEQAEQAFDKLQVGLDACDQATKSAYDNFETDGVSVNLVFKLRQLHSRIERARELLDCVIDTKTSQATIRLLAHLTITAEESRNISSLIGSNIALLATKVSERSAEVGEHYISRTPREFCSLFKKAAGGGMLMAVTTYLKFLIMALSLSVFWSGFYAGINYSISFLVIYFLHLTIATKQPAVTAPALAKRLKQQYCTETVNDFVDEVTNLTRSQFAGVLGNILFVFPTVILLSWVLVWLFDQPMLDAAQAAEQLKALSGILPTIIFAGYTGLLLFLSNLIAGWTENWFVLNEIEAAIRYHPRYSRWFGFKFCDRLAHWCTKHVSGISSNVSLGLMLGIMPTLAMFFAIDLEVRHVTLSSGQLGAVVGTLGWDLLQMHSFWMCIVCIAITGLINIVVSFSLAMRVAILSQHISSRQDINIQRAILWRLIRYPWHFFWPPKQAKTKLEP